MADEDTPCMLVRDGAYLVFRMPIARLLQLTADSARGTYDIIDAEGYIADLMKSLNRGHSRTDVEALFACEIDHVATMGAKSVRVVAKVAADDVEYERSDDDYFGDEGSVPYVPEPGEYDHAEIERSEDPDEDETFQPVVRR